MKFMPIYVVFMVSSTVVLSSTCLVRVVFLFLPCETCHPRAQQHGHHSSSPGAVISPSDLTRTWKKHQLHQHLILKIYVHTIYNVRHTILFIWYFQSAYYLKNKNKIKSEIVYIPTYQAQTGLSCCHMSVWPLHCPTLKGTVHIPIRSAALQRDETHCEYK